MASRPRADWIVDHQRRYIESNGQDGHEWRGMTTLLLTTTGHKSGKQTTTPLIYGKSGENYLVVASRGGAPTHPKWYLNLEANPAVELQVGADHVKGKARTATDAEKPALWKIMTGIFPTYDEYQAKTTRNIPLVVIEPV